MFLDKSFFKNKNIFVVAILIYVITAINSKGYFHADEHFQIIEFSEYKMGHRTAQSLPWEYKAKMRSAIQPGLAFVVQKSLSVLGNESPYTLTLILRLMTAVLALFVIRFFVKQTEKFFTNERSKITYHLLSYFLWFIPFVSVRFSSETWSALLFLLAMALFLRNRKETFLIGIVLGFSFLFRFQIAFAIVGFGLWLIFTQKEKWIFYVQILLPFLFILCIGILIDNWFYGEFVFTPWHYFDLNILQDAASNFGKSPWYFYLQKLLLAPSLIVGIPLTIALIVLIVKQPKNLFIWIFFTFLIGHSIVAHKEMRFLFPMIYFFPILLIHGYLEIKNHLPIWRPARAFFVLLALVNVLGLAVMSQKSAGLGYIELTSFIHKNYKNEAINLIHTPYANPYSPWSEENNIYSEKDMQFVFLDSLLQQDMNAFIENKKNLLVIQKYDLNHDSVNLFLEKGFVEVKHSIPQWIVFVNKIYGGFEEGNVLVLFEQKNKNESNR